MQDEAKATLSHSDIFFIRTILCILMLGFGAVIALKFGSHYVQRSFIEQEKGIANLITLTASQRLHSQRIGLLTFLCISAKSVETKSKILNSLREEITEMEKNQKILASQSELASKEVGYSQEVIDILYQSPLMLNAKVQKFISTSNDFYQESLNDSKKQNEIAYAITEISSELLSGFGLLMEQFREEGNQGIENLIKQSRNIFIIESLVIFLIAAYVMVPLFKRLRSEFIGRNSYQAQLEVKNSELSDFASIIAHDLKAPLANIISFSSILKEGIVDHDEKSKFDILKSIDSCAVRMNSMITDLLTYSKIAGSTDSFEVVSLQEIAVGVISSFELELEQIDGSVECLSLPNILGCKIKCEHLLQNLIGNAIKYRDKDKNLKITIYEVDPLEDAFVRILIKDNGLGFPAGMEDYIFEPFKRSTNDQSIEGTGLGLALCKKIVEQHGGTIRAYPSPNTGGACFEFTLPNAVREV